MEGFLHYKELIKHLSIISAYHASIHGLCMVLWWGGLFEMVLNENMLFLLILSHRPSNFPLFSPPYLLFTFNFSYFSSSHTSSRCPRHPLVHLLLCLLLHIFSAQPYTSSLLPNHPPLSFQHRTSLPTKARCWSSSQQRLVASPSLSSSPSSSWSLEGKSTSLPLI